MRKGSEGAALAALRKQTRKACLVCGKTFKAIATARYCSNACRQKAKYQRSKAAPDKHAANAATAKRIVREARDRLKERV
jgi:predicted nucleic acid-binding Zn ribbon protein